MNTDIRISTSFLNHRKRKKLVRLLGEEGVCRLIDLWINTAVNRPKGVLFDMDVGDIADDANWVGNPNILVDALISSRFLDIPNTKCEWHSLHDWEEHQPWVFNANERSEQARNAANVRWGSDQDADSNNIGQCGEDAGSIQPAQNEDTESNPPILSSPILSSQLPKSTATAEINLPTKDQLENGSPILIKQTIKDMVEKLYNEKLFTKVHSFKNKMVQEGMNDSAILHTLSQCYTKGVTGGFGKEGGAWAYGVSIMKVENGNYNERDHAKTS